MVTRRRFLQGSLASAGLASAAGAFAAGPALGALFGAGSGRLPLAAALYEHGRPHSEGFAGVARELGITAFDIGTDMTPAWLDIVARWRERPVAIAGMTARVALLVLEQSARDHGLRVVYLGEHRPAAGGRQVEHQLQGPPDIVQAFHDGLGTGAGYGVCVADALNRCPARIARGSRRQMRLVSTQAGTADPATLYSWVIAPRDRVIAQGATT